MIIDMLLGRSEIVETYKVGSRVTCDPPPVNTDTDTLVYTNASRFEKTLIRDGWSCDTPTLYGRREGGSSLFTSYRLGSDNYLVTRSEDFRDKFLLATRVAAKLNLLRKEDRVSLFQAILYGNG